MGMNHNRQVEHGVKVVYGITEYKLSAKDLQLISDALEIISPDAASATKRARALSAAFLGLSEYAATAAGKKTPSPKAKQVNVFLEGGVIHDIEVPPAVRVTVYDYDTEGVEADRIEKGW